MADQFQIYEQRFAPRDYAILEGDRWIMTKASGTSVKTVAANTAGSGALLTSGSWPVVGRIVFLDYILMTVNGAGYYQVNIPATASLLNSGAWQAEIQAPSAGTYRIEVGQFMRAINTLASGATVFVTNTTAASIDYQASLDFVGMLVTDDINFAAAKTLLCITDSIGGGIGATTSLNTWPYRVRRLLRDQGNDVRLILKPNPGATTGGMDTLLQRGWLDVGRVSGTVYAISVNDAIQAIDPDSVNGAIANINKAYAYHKVINPNSPFVLLGPTPLENNTAEAAAVTLRQKFAAWAASAGVRYIDVGNVFDRTQGTSVYATSDTAGQRVHPNDAGHIALSNKITADLTSTPIILG